MLPGASLVWSVLRTRWPVNEAFDGNLCSFQIANFTYKNDVRVLSQVGPSNCSVAL